MQPLLDAVVGYLPAPHEGSPLRDARTGSEIERSASAPLVAFCFKVSFDRFGQLTFVRVYGGELRKGTTVWNSTMGRDQRVGRLVRMFADSQEEVEVLRAGDIGAIVGGSYRTGETLSDPDRRFVLESIVAPEPVLRLAIEPQSRSDRDRLGPAMGRLLAEDPSLTLRTDPQTGQSILGGLGQLHLEVSIERLRLEYGVVVRGGRPEVAFRETVSGSVEHEVKHVKQTGGPGQYAHIRIRLRSAPRGSGLAFEDLTRGGVIAAEYIPGVRKGIEEAMQSGVLGGYPVTDVHVALVDGSQHSNDSSEMAFKHAGGIAFREACRLADPVLLEPIVNLEILVPDDQVGSVVGDLGSRRANVLSLDQQGTTRVIVADVPLTEMFDYANCLNTITHGRGQHSMSFSHYAEVPKGIVDRLLGGA